MKIIHAHLKYIWNKSTKNLKETLKALGGVDFTKYALPTIIVSNGQEMAENLKNIGKKLLKIFSKDVKMLTE